MSVLQKGARVIHLKERDGFIVIEGFKKLIVRDNIIELTAAVVIADAFNLVINNLVDKVIDLTIGGLLGKPNFNSIGEFHVGNATVQSSTVLTVPIAFLLIATAVYLAFVFPMDRLNERMARRKGLNTKEAEVSDEVRLLMEIRDALAGGGYMNGGGAAGGSYMGGGYYQ